jgi:hypothetical protein
MAAALNGRSSHSARHREQRRAARGQVSHLGQVTAHARTTSSPSTATTTTATTPHLSVHESAVLASAARTGRRVGTVRPSAGHHPHRAAETPYPVIDAHSASTCKSDGRT